MKKHLLLLLAALLPVVASAYDAKIDGIYYDFSGNEAIVTYQKYQYYAYTSDYSGDVVIPSSVTYNGKTYRVTSIADHAFKHCYNLTSITIPNSVTSIGGDAFSCCSSLTSITIPNSVTSIGDDAFYICGSLTSVTIGNGVTSIGSYAFRECSSLTSVTIPNSVTSIDYGAFSYCSSLTSIKVETGNTKYDSRNDCNAIIETATNTLIAGCMNTVIPESVTSIADYAFSGCSSLTSVTIPNSVTSIPLSAFSGCSSLTSVTIPNSVTSISAWAFSGCRGLTSITIPNSVTSIGGGAFSGCRGLTSITIPNSVTSIYDSAFSGCFFKTDFFVNNSSLTSDNNWGATLYDEERSDGLIIINNIVVGCRPWAVSITIPNNVTSIADYAFSRCSGLTSVNIPESVTSIGRSTFSGCSSLTSITIPNSVTSIIGSYAFEDCTSLTSITIPNSVTSIGVHAFSGCSSLTSIIIGNSVTSIGDYAFAYCSGLTEVYCYAENVPSTYSYVFSESPIASATLHVPASSISSYSTRKPWSGFGQIVAINATYYTITYYVDGKVYKTYEVEEGSAITPEPAPTKEGYTFSGWTYIPPTMPAADVVVMGSFTINSYTLTYKVDGEVYKSYDVEYGSAITPEPAPTKEGYTFSGWSEIPETMPAHNVTITGTFTKDKLGTCATPTISYANGKLTFNCETEDVIFHSTITDTDITSYLTQEVELCVTYTISVYATKEEYEDSEVATGTLCWIDQQPNTEGIVAEDAVTEVKALPVLIQSNGGTITVQGANEGTEIMVYSVNGMKQGSAIATNGFATINTSLRPGSTAIVKIGEKAVKVLIK